MYFVEEGKAAAYVNGLKVAQYGRGDWCAPPPKPQINVLPWVFLHELAC